MIMFDIMNFMNMVKLILTNLINLMNFMKENADYQYESILIDKYEYKYDILMVAHKIRVSDINRNI